MKALHDSGALAAECQALTFELQSLQKVLLLTDYVLHAHRATPLADVLASVVAPEVAKCHLVLEGFWKRIETCQRAILSTVIAALWRRVVWAALNEAAALSAKLSSHRERLTMLLVSLLISFSQFRAPYETK